MTITCVNCGGKGYVLALTMGGYKIPRTCGGCGGTGKQTVRP